MKKFFPAAASIVLMAMPVFAQDAPMSPAQRSLPSETFAPTVGPSGSTVASSLAGSVSAKKLINKSVKNAANESVGDINDILIGSDGRVAAVIVGVGGFLGMGEKDVALPFGQLVIAKDADDDLGVSTSMTKEALQSAPEYVRPDKR
jgi:hypothetical protein